MITKTETRHARQEQKVTVPPRHVAWRERRSYGHSATFGYGSK